MHFNFHHQTPSITRIRNVLKMWLSSHISMDHTRCITDIIIRDGWQKLSMWIKSINKIYIIKHFQKYAMIPEGKSAFSIIWRDWLYRHYTQMMWLYIIVYAAYVYEPLLGNTCVMITSLSHLQYLSYKLCLFFIFFVIYWNIY